MAYKRNPEKYTVGGVRIDPKLMFEFQKELKAKKQKAKPIEKPVEKPVEAAPSESISRYYHSEKKKVSLRELLQRRKNRGLYDEVFEMVAISEDI